MVSLEQVKLLESKVAKTIDYVNKVTGENYQLKEKLFSCEKRIEELEVLVQRFNDSQSRIEEGILSTLDRLNQLEDVLDSKSQKPDISPEILPELLVPGIPVDTPVEKPEELGSEELNSKELRPNGEVSPPHELDIF